MNSLLIAQNIRKNFTIKDNQGRAHLLKAVDGVSLDIAPGEIVGIVGESGCGKSTLGRTILRLYEPDSGTITWKGKNLNSFSREEMKALRKAMQMIFQDPFSSLNPRKKVKNIIAQPLLVHKADSPEETARRVEAVMKEVGLNPAYKRRYPHQFSGGQRQRIGIARALILEPELIVCDEAVSALDVSIQAQILNLILDLREKHGFATLFISHDLAVVEFIAERILVMYLGRIVEKASKTSLTENPLHPYTRALFEAFPSANPSRRLSKKHIVMGDVPSPLNPPSGCHFHPRCPLADEKCRQSSPPLSEVSPGHWAACWKSGV
ncbi:MAG: oligopeptide ABC transporter ATP-binding protein OppF [Spirochaeta sp. LUC14_002_19_P3]|nr:MAG: oligopeptide ABC transporter ATP-binding protein OppF [Spirochaeta sp. LUC14_002_19_P3]